MNLGHTTPWSVTGSKETPAHHLEGRVIYPTWKNHPYVTCPTLLYMTFVWPPGTTLSVSPLDMWPLFLGLFAIISNLVHIGVFEPSPICSSFLQMHTPEASPIVLHHLSSIYHLSPIYLLSCLSFCHLSIYIHLLCVYLCVCMYIHQFISVHTHTI
jgi:hypothetical protein